jgi:hypothetical protein
MPQISNTDPVYASWSLAIEQTTGKAGNIKQ